MLELEEEIGAGDDFPAFVSRRVVAGVQHDLVIMAFDCRDAALHGECHRAERSARFVGERDAAPELDDPIVADVDAVMVVAARAVHFQVIAGLESACHA